MSWGPCDLGGLVTLGSSELHPVRLSRSWPVRSAWPGAALEKPLGPQRTEGDRVTLGTGVSPEQAVLEVNREAIVLRGLQGWGGLPKQIKP